MEEKKSKKSLIIFSIIIAIILIIIGTGYTIAITTDIGSLADSAAANSGDFWNVTAGHAFASETNVYSKRQWMCFTEKKNSGIGNNGIRVRSITDINGNGTYTTQIYGQGTISGNNTYNAKKLAYLCYAATVAGGTGLVGGGSVNNGARNALYYFFNSTDLSSLIGPFSNKRESSYLTQSGKVGATVLSYADRYARTETTGSSATITSHSDTDAEVKVTESNGTSYSYIGPFSMTTAGTISGVTITDGSNNPTVAGFSNSVGGTVQNVSGIPTNGNKFYIVTTAVLTNLEVKVRITTSGSSGGGEIVNPNTGAVSTGYIKARIIFIGADSSQGTSVFRGDPVPTQPSTDEVEFTAKNNLGKLIVRKIGNYTGIENYENVKDFGFKIYYLSGGQKKYLRINDQSSIRGQTTISIGASTSYDASSSNATVIHTSDNGSVTIDNISIEYQYYIEEVDEDLTNYAAELIEATVQIGNGAETNLPIDGNIAGPIEVELKGPNNTATKVKLVDYRKRANLTIEKVDADDYNTKLGNVEFKIRNTDTGRYVIANKVSDGVYEITDPMTAYTENEAEATVFVTNSTDGTIVITGLDVGNYETIELNNPNYGYTLIPDNVQFEHKEEGTLVTVTNEKQTGNLKIEKIDMDNESHPLPGVSFKLRNSEGYIIAIDNDGNVQKRVEGTINLGGLETTSNEAEATEFITDQDGVVRIYDLLIGEYQVVEVSIGDNFGYELDEAQENGLDINAIISWESNMGSGTGTTSSIEIFRQSSVDTRPGAGTNDEIFDILTIKNKRVYVKLSGYVWEDIVSGKQAYKNDLWKDDTNDDADKRLANVQVTLKKADGSVLDTRTTGTITNSNNEQEEGAYIFGDYLRDPSAKKIKIDDLDGAYIEFVYNGMCYKSVEVHADLNNGSKATDDALRPQFNENYAIIVNNESQNGNGQSVYRLNYDFANNVSTLNYGGQYLYGYDGQRYPIAGIDEQYLITANTKDATPSAFLGQTAISYDSIRKQSIDEIPYINLGVYEREMPDLAVKEDIEQATISLNGYTHTYRYDQRFNDSQETDGFNMTVKFGTDYGNASYTREIFSSDVSYNVNNPGSLQMFIRYKVAIRNEATTVYTTTNQIVNYFDENYDISSIQTESGEELNYTVDSSYNQNGYKRVYIDVNSQNRPQSDTIVYIEYQLQNDAINTVLNQDVTLKSVTEITSYSSYEEDFSTRYAGIDKDSNPGSAEPTSRETYEDDTDSAPSFIVTVREGRKITGTVWEDAAREELLGLTGYDKERKGDGYLGDAEGRIEGVKVDLLSVGDDVDLSNVNVLDNNLSIAQLYKMDTSVVDATYTTGTDGYYEFVGVIPGKYLIRYTYGNNSVIYDTEGNKVSDIEIINYKATIYRGGDKDSATSMSNFWYREDSTDDGNRLSDARDQVGINKNGDRIDIVDYRTTPREINYGLMTNEETQLQEIEAATRGFEVELDYDEDLNHISEYGEYFRIEFQHVDLGIIRRPIQTLELSKNITYIRVTLANGQVVIEGNPQTDNLQHVRFLPDGNVAIELDSELIQGATLTIRYGITVDNTKAEIDYNDQDYYIYGIVPSDRENKFKLATVKRLFDYLSNDLQFDPDNPLNGDWTLVDITEDLVTQGYLSPEAYEVIKGYNQVLQTEAFENMKPGETKTVEMEVSRLLSNDADDFTLDNYIEVNILWDKPMDESTPGNLVPGNSTTYENDDDHVDATITGPTGENQNYVPYVILGISTFVILGAGIVFIKKKVL